MFKKKYRLGFKTKTIFERTFKTPYFTVKIAKNNLFYNRYGFIIAKRIDKRAVIRNRIKRLIRQGAEDLVKDLKEGYDILFIAAKESSSASLDEIKKIQRDLFFKEGLLR